MTDGYGAASISFEASASSLESSCAASNPEASDEEFSLSTETHVVTSPSATVDTGSPASSAASKVTAPTVASPAVSFPASVASGSRALSVVSPSVAYVPSSFATLRGYGSGSLESADEEMVTVFAISARTSATGEATLPSCVATSACHLNGSCVASWQVSYGVACSTGPASAGASVVVPFLLSVDGDSGLAVTVAAQPYLVAACSSVAWSGFIIGKIDTAVVPDLALSAISSDYATINHAGDFLLCRLECCEMIYQGTRVYLYIEPMACPTTRGGDHTPAQTSPIVVTVTSPSGLVTTPAVLQSATPTEYYASWYVDEPNVWTWKVVAGTASLGAVRASSTGSFNVGAVS